MRPVGFDICYELREERQDDAPLESEVWAAAIFRLRIPVNVQIRLKTELKRLLIK